MQDDPIVQEVREAREAHAARFRFDLDAIVDDLRRAERASPKTFRRHAPRKVEPASKK